MELFSRRFFKENFFEFLLELGSVSGILFFYLFACSFVVSLG